MSQLNQPHSSGSRAGPVQPDGGHQPAASQGQRCRKFEHKSTVGQPNRKTRKSFKGWCPLHQGSLERAPTGWPTLSTPGPAGAPRENSWGVHSQGAPLLRQHQHTPPGGPGSSCSHLTGHRNPVPVSGDQLSTTRGPFREGDIRELYGGASGRRPSCSLTDVEKKTWALLLRLF